MQWEEIEALPREKLLILLQNALGNIVRVDGYWFMELEKAAGMATTVAVDEAVWRRMGGKEARQIREAFPLPEEPIPALAEAVRLNPAWATWGEFELETPSARQAILRIPQCRAQEARVKLGLQVFPCRPVDEAYFSSFAQAIDPRLKTTCEFAPPNDGQPGLWCRWRFELPE